MNFAHIELPFVTPSAEEVELFEALDRARILANAIEHHAPQTRTYGAASRALGQALTFAHLSDRADWTRAEYNAAESWAYAVLDVVIDSGESVAYAMQIVEESRDFDAGDFVQNIVTRACGTVADYMTATEEGHLKISYAGQIRYWHPRDIVKVES